LTSHSVCRYRPPDFIDSYRDVSWFGEGDRLAAKFAVDPIAAFGVKTRAALSLQF
jgi:hypothetical protein